MFNLLLDSIIGVLDIEGRREHLFFAAALFQAWQGYDRDISRIATPPAARLACAIVPTRGVSLLEKRALRPA
jgi:hypothetical protein